MTATSTGRLLVAAPSLRDPNFERTVVLVIEHGDEGAVGVVLNRPSKATVSEILPAWKHLATEPAMVFVGGPVALSGAICLGRSAPEPGPESLDAAGQRGPKASTGWRRLFADVAIVDLEVDPDPAAGDIRVFAGHAGWGPTQLEAEIEAKAWFVLDAEPGDALTATPETLWSTVLRRQGGALARVSNFPDDPSTN